MVNMQFAQQHQPKPTQSVPTLKLSLSLPSDPAEIARKVVGIARDGGLEPLDKVMYLKHLYSQNRDYNRLFRVVVLGAHTLKALAGLCDRNRPIRCERDFQDLIGDITNHFKEHPTSYNSRNIAEMMSDVSHIGYRDNSFMKMAASRLLNDSATNVIDLSRALFSAAHLDIKTPHLVRAVEEGLIEYQSLIREGNNPFRSANTTLAQGSWALAQMAPTRVSRVLSGDALHNPKLSPQEWTLMYQALVVGHVIEPGGLRMNEMTANFSERHGINSDSGFERSVGIALHRYCETRGWRLEEQSVIGLVASDFCITTDDNKRIVIECDGELYHSAIGPNGKRKMGRDILQDRLFRAHGVDHIIHLWKEDWDLDATRAPYFLDAIFENLNLGEHR